ncbi:MAG: hypothetical protein E7554_01740 [Ruminococcaceae bacterium]|nr:hypothetical protein [Oscillospiraceae bacterium]
MDYGHLSRRQLITRNGLVMFSLGASVYPVVELVWRGRTHWTMSVTGGLCTLLIHLCNRRMSSRGTAARCGAGCAVITLTEFAVGCVVNRLLGWNVWDYSSAPLNILGQICPLYCGFWFVLSLPVLAVSTWLEEHTSRREIVFP